MSKLKDCKDFLSRLLFVPRCAGCGARLSPIAREDNLSYGKVCFCPDCMQKWQIAKRDMCHTCYLPAGECTCTKINRKINQPFIPSLFFYHPNRSLAQNRVLYSAKTKHYPELFDFLARELAPSVDKLIESQGARREDCVLTWLPRSQAAIKKYGHDQAKLICLALSAQLGISALPLLTRKGGTEQKKLDAKKRAKNTEQSVFLNTKLKAIKVERSQRAKVKIGDFVSNKTVILIDDIITTGASMRRGILLLEPQKPSAVLCACVARCEIKSK